MQRNILLVITVAIVLVGYSLVLPGRTNADGCLSLYGGGLTNRQLCPTPMPERAQDTINKTVTKPNVVSQTKGGLPIYPTTQKKTTPDTGPETLWTLALLPLAGMGFFLRNKSIAKNQG